MSTNSSPFQPFVTYATNLARWPFALTQSSLEHHADLQQKTLALTQELSFDHMQDVTAAARAYMSTALAAPFDAMRAQYAASVRAGVIECSMLGWRDFERKLASVEKLALGPLARMH